MLASRKTFAEDTTLAKTKSVKSASKKFLWRDTKYEILDTNSPLRTICAGGFKKRGQKAHIFEHFC